MKLRWHARPAAGSFQRAERLLAEQTTPAEAARVVGKIRHAEAVSVPVSELAGNELPPLDAPRVQRELQRIAAGKELRPVVAVRRAGRVSVLDGHHRVVAVRHLDFTGTVRTVVANQGETTMSKIEKAEEKFAAELADATIAVEKMDSSDPFARAAARKRLAKLQGTYLQDHSVGYARAEEMRKADAAGRAPAADGPAAKAERILKADPTIAYDDLLAKFTKEEQAEYLDSVRGRAA